MGKKRGDRKEFKVRTRLTALDVRALASDLRHSIQGMRCQNVFDVSPRVYMLKLSQGENRAFVLVEAPERIHTTQFARAKSDIPSIFTLKLRKHVRGKRLEGVSQLGVDRVIDLQFGVGENAFHVIVELYAQGNVVLADASYSILASLRKHQYADGSVVGARHEYPLHLLKRAPSICTDIAAAVAEAQAPPVEDADAPPAEGDDEEKPQQQQQKKMVERVETVRDVLNRTCPELGAHLVDHALLRAGIAPTLVPKLEPLSAEQQASLNVQLLEAAAFFDAFDSSAPKGWIMLKPADAGAAPAKPEERYFDFTPYLYDQFRGLEAVEYPSFNAALDEFFTKLESAQLERQRASQEAAVERKIEKSSREHRERLELLTETSAKHELHARLIESNLELVDRAINELRAALALGMSWEDLEAMVRTLRKTDPSSIANVIDKLVLKENKAVILLSDPFDDYDAAKGLERVEIDLGMTAYANAQRHFETKKQVEVKAQKTAEITEEVMKRAEKKHMTAMQKTKVPAAIAQMRKRFWFEKFHWFVSSENFIVISGKDAQQNEFLYRRHLRERDLYIHADIHGAASCIVKNPLGATIGGPTLEQAGRHAVCRSSAWNAKVVTSAWWVNPSQVSKSAPSGEYLNTGSFMIRGKKNYLPPHPLIMGFGLLFVLDQVSVPAHLGERKPLGVDATVEDNLQEPKTREEDWDTIAQSKLSDDESETEEKEDKEEVEGDVSANLPKAVADHEEPKEKKSEYPVGDEKVETTTEPAVEQIKEKRQVKQKQQKQIPAVEPKTEGKEPEETEQEDKKPLGNKPRISAYQRRQMKKKKKQGLEGEQEEETSEPAAEPEVENKDEDSPSEEEEEEESSKKNVPQGPLPRGRKGKLKKMKKKYADQDDEDREIAMMLLGSKKQEPKGKDKGKDKGADKTNQAGKQAPISAAAAAAAAAAPSRVCFHCGEAGHFAHTCPKKKAEGKAHENTGQKPKAPVADDDAEGVEEAYAEDSDEEGPATEASSTTEADRLTGQPRPDDVILSVLPVCAPYDAMQGYKFKVKLTPGHLKRSKAVETAITLFTKQPDCTPRERQLITSIPTDEMLQCILGDVKVAGGQAAALKKPLRKK